MRDCWVIVDVGCLECSESTEVLGVFTDGSAARERFDELVRALGEETPVGDPDEVPIRVALSSGQHSLELHRGVPLSLSPRQATNEGSNSPG